MATIPAGSAVDAQARFGQSVKGLLTEKATSCGTDVIALTKQVLKGSRSAEVSKTTSSHPLASNLRSARAKPQRILGCVVFLYDAG